MVDMTEMVKTKLEGFLEDGYLAGNPVGLQNLSLAIYRLLAKGKAVQVTDLASAMNVTALEIEELISLVPASAYDRARDQSFVSFIGLSTIPAAHQFKVGAQILYTWCVFDALFLPAILRQQAVLTTACPSTGQTIEVTVSPDGVKSAMPPQPVMSIIAPDTDACCSDLRGAFCNQINLFADRAAFSSWSKRGDADDCISLDDAFTLAIRRNEARFPDVSLADTL
jgi:alkylmercury lyase